MMMNYTNEYVMIIGRPTIDWNNSRIYICSIIQVVLRYDETSKNIQICTSIR